MKRTLISLAISMIPAIAGELSSDAHVAYIPQGSDVSSIRFEGIRRVEIATRTTSASDAAYCAQLQFRDPGGSMYCPQVKVESRATAFEVTYSFLGQPMASDEFGNGRFRFHVYFDPAELTSEMREMASARRAERKFAAEMFSVKISGEPVRRVVIDDRRSSFCDGNYIDGAWTHTDSKCVDRVEYRTISAPSDYVAVRIDAVQPHASGTRVAPIR
jgi:hypothetical protein